MPDMPSLFRVYMALDRRRKAGGLLPHEMSRWVELKRTLNEHFQPGIGDQHADQRESVRVPLALKVKFESYGEIRECLMTNLSLGGIFVATTSPLPIGTSFLVHLCIEESGEQLEILGKVVSQDVSADLSREERGMGIRFVDLSDEQRNQVNELYEHAMKKVSEGN